MIGRLNGIILSKKAPWILIEVQGIGYEVQTSLHTFFQLTENLPAVLYTHLVVSDNAHHLYGFFDEAERHLFRQLIKVSGIGPKSALSVLSKVTPAELINYLQQKAVAQLTQLPGIGKKTAARLIIEMQDFVQLEDTNPAEHVLSPARQDAFSALLALGYKSKQANQMLETVDRSYTRTDQILKEALKLSREYHE